MEISEGQVANKHILLIIVKRFAILLFVISFMAFLFWAIGNFRRFLDETELMLLAVLRFTSFLLLPVSALGIGVTAAIKSDRRLIQRLQAVGGYLFLLLFASAGAFLSTLLTYLATGLR